MKKPRLKFILKVVLTLAIIAGVYFVYRSIRNYYYERQLAEVIARLDAAEPGWQWEDRFARLPKLSKEENAGEEIKAIMRLLTLDEYRAKLGRNEWSFGYSNFESSPLAEANREFMKDHPNALLPALNRKEMAKLLASSPCPDALRRARNLTQYSMGLLPHQFRPILAMSGLPDAQTTRELIRLFTWNVALEAEAKHSEQAANDISTMLHIVRIYDHDPFQICNLVRAALVNMTCHAPTAGSIDATGPAYVETIAGRVYT